MNIKQYLDLFSPKSLRTISGFIIFCVVLFQIVSNPRTNPQQTPAPAPSTTPASQPTQNTDITTTTSSAQSEQPLSVDHIIDGDTIVVLVEGTKTTVRLIGMNSPETGGPYRGVECFGREATAYAKSLLTNTAVSVESDPTQQVRDKYNRMLAYVMLADGRDFGATMIESGYAYEYTYNSRYQKQSLYKQLQKNAQAKGQGFWSSSTCAGKRELSP